MNRLVHKHTTAYKVEIFIGGDLADAKVICLAYCTEVGLCVTVEPTTYVYRNGSCEGVRVGLINYARFPTDWEKVYEKALGLAFELKEGLNQGSFTIQDHEESHFYSTRDEDQ